MSSCLDKKIYFVRRLRELRSYLYLRRVPRDEETRQIALSFEISREKCLPVFREGNEKQRIASITWTRARDASNRKRDEPRDAEIRGETGTETGTNGGGVIDRCRQSVNSFAGRPNLFRPGAEREEIVQSLFLCFRQRRRRRGRRRGCRRHRAEPEKRAQAPLVSITARGVMRPTFIG